MAIGIAEGEDRIGIDLNGARFLTFAKSLGVDFTTTAMIGRQQLHFTGPDIHRLLLSCGQNVSDADVTNICRGSAGYAENFLRFLGAKTAHSFDYSDYEKPTYTHDMNQPIPDGFKESYSALIDGGSLEHIFDFPVAIKNCMEMIEIGGHYLAITPANNFFGHGFYQFSPELYFTVLSVENGFQIRKIIAFEDKADPVWYVVKSPREIGCRVTLSNSLPLYLLVIAEKIGRAPIFEHVPQQSDYVTLWGEQKSGAMTGSGHVEPKRRSLAMRVAKTVLPRGVRMWLLGVFERSLPNRRGFDPSFFERMEWPSSTSVRRP